MDNKRKYLICKHCGNLVGLIHDAGVTPVCCGQPMTVLKANTTDAATEKHVPVVTRNGKELKVVVGSTEHPMTEEHYITWIAVAQGNRTQRTSLAPGEHPSASFVVAENEPVTVYEYCNLHGLWSADA